MIAGFGCFGKDDGASMAFFSLIRGSKGGTQCGGKASSGASELTSPVRELLVDWRRVGDGPAVVCRAVSRRTRLGWAIDGLPCSFSCHELGRLAIVQVVWWWLWGSSEFSFGPEGAVNGCVVRSDDVCSGAVVPSVLYPYMALEFWQ